MLTVVCDITYCELELEHYNSFAEGGGTGWVGSGGLVFGFVLSRKNTHRINTQATTSQHNTPQQSTPQQIASKHGSAQDSPEQHNIAQTAHSSNFRVEPLDSLALALALTACPFLSLPVSSSLFQSLTT